MQQIIQDKTSGSQEIIDISHYVRLLKQSWFKITLFSAMVTAVAVLVVLQITPQYTATATLLIEAQEKKAVSIQEVVGIDSTQKEYYQTQFEILKSNQIAEKVINKLHLDKLVEFNSSLNTEPTIIDEIKSIPLVASILKEEDDQRTAEEIEESIRQSVLTAFQDKLVISPIRSTQLVQISFTSQDAKLSAQIANEVGYAYIEQNLESRLSSTRYATSWISGRLASLQQQLSDSEKALSDFLIKEKLIDDSGIDVLASQELSSLTERLSEVRDRRIEVESTYSALRNTDSRNIAAISAIPALSSHPQVVAIRKAQLDAQNEVNQLSKRYGPKHDKMLGAVARLDAVKDQVQGTTRQLIDGFGKELQALRKQEGLLQETIDGRRSEFQQLTVKRSQYDVLKREVQTNRDVLNVFLTSQKETTATQDFNAAIARFTDEALVPQFASAPKKKLIVAIAIIASVGFAIVLVFIIDVMKNTIESVKNFEDKFGLIPLGGVPIVNARRFRKKPLDNSVLFDEHEIPFSESIRSIRTSLMLNKREGNKRLAITSSNPSEGKTTVSINIAMAFAKLEKTLLIDCDLRKSSIAERFGMKRFQQGLANCLMMDTELEDCLYKDEKSGLTILPAGMLVTNPQELLSSPKFVELLERLDSQFDRIIIDTPPSLPVSDSLIIGQLTKSALVVVKAEAVARSMGEKGDGKMAWPMP